MGTLETALVDHIALVDIADRACLSPAQVRRVCAELAELPAEQVVRMVGEAARIERCGKKGKRHA